MPKCPNCGKETLSYTGQESDVLPPPPNTNWAPLPRQYNVYRCTNCGNTTRDRVVTSSSSIVDGRSCYGLMILLMLGVGAVMLFGGLSQISRGGGFAAVLGLVFVVVGALAWLDQLKKGR